jgi:uncharacterized membrane protein YfcA
VHRQRGAGPPTAFGGERFESAAVDGHDGELGGDEERGGQDQEDDGQEAEGGADGDLLQTKVKNTNRSDPDPTALSPGSAPITGTLLLPARLPSMSTGQLLLACAVLALGALAQGLVGFGQALVAAPLLLLIDTRLVPGPITVASISVNLLMLTQDRGQADTGGLRWSVTGLVPGTAAAAVALAVLSGQALAITAGCLILVAVGLSAVGLSARPTPRTLTGAGFFSGFMGTVAAVGGPPMALLYQRAGGPRLRATLARFFTVSSALTLVALTLAGRLGPTELGAGLVLVPGAVAGWALSRRLVVRVDRLLLRPAVLTLSAASAIALLIRELT